MKAEELHLNDDQLAELLQMGIAGRMAADELRLWRDADEGPWFEDSLEGINCQRHHGAPTQLYMPEDFENSTQNLKAIIHSRNTVELRVAALYYQFRMFGANNFTGPRRMKVWQAAKEKADAIAQAYSGVTEGDS